MGTDIHLYVQKQDPHTHDWTFVDPPESVLDALDREQEQIRVQLGKPVIRRWYRQQNYRLFAMLAGVCNRDNILTIAKPRGLPLGFESGIYEARIDDPPYVVGEGSSLHGHHWLSLREVLDYPAKQFVIRTRGVINEKDYKHLQETGIRPWPSSGVGGKFILVNEDGMKHLIGKGGDILREQELSYHCETEWDETYFDSAEWFFGVVVPEIVKIVGEANIDNCRLVMWFDT